jgi:DNA-binding ferritin-like protein
MNLIETLEQVFATNFQVYYRTHVAHVNIVGRNFISDHELLGGIYEGFQGNIDTLGEMLRTLKRKMPNSLGKVQSLSVVGDIPVTGTSEELLQSVYDDLDIMIELYTDLYRVADEEQHTEISNFSQDQLGLLRKSCWKLRSVLEDSDEEEDDGDEEYSDYSEY